MSHKIQVSFVHHHLSGQCGVKGVEIALPVGHLYNCIFFLFFFLYEAETQQSQHVS